MKKICLISAKAAIACALLVLLLQAACKCDATLSVNQKSETDLGSHHVVVKPGAAFTETSSVTGGDRAEYIFKCGKITVLIRDEELIVNDKTYGLLKPDDGILIDRGTVYVNDKVVEGKPLSDEAGSGIAV